MTEIERGRCRMCGCTDADPCKLGGGDECGWQNQLHTVCTKPSCLRRYFAEWKAWKAKHRRLAPWEVEERRRQEKNRKQRERRARAKAQKLLQQQIQRRKK